MGWLKAIGAAVELWQRQYPTRSPVLNSLFARPGWIFGCFVQRCRITVSPFTFIADTMIQFDSIRVWNILQAFGTALCTVTSLLKWSKPTHLLAPSIYVRRRSWQSSCPWKQIRISVMISWSKGGPTETDMQYIYYIETSTLYAKVDLNMHKLIIIKWCDMAIHNLPMPPLWHYPTKKKKQDEKIQETRTSVLSCVPTNLVLQGLWAGCH